MVLASEGYPGSYPKGKVITGTEVFSNRADVMIFQAGTVAEGGELKTSGGRVLAVIGMSSELKEAQEKAYQAIKFIHFDGMH